MLQEIYHVKQYNVGGTTYRDLTPKSDTSMLFTQFRLFDDVDLWAIATPSAYPNIRYVRCMPYIYALATTPTAADCVEITNQLLDACKKAPDNVQNIVAHYKRTLQICDKEFAEKELVLSLIFHGDEIIHLYSPSDADIKAKAYNALSDDRKAHLTQFAANYIQEITRMERELMPSDDKSSPTPLSILNVVQITDDKVTELDNIIISLSERDIHQQLIFNSMSYVATLDLLAKYTKLSKVEREDVG